MPIGKREIEFLVQIVVKPDEDGYHAYCPVLKGLHTCGDTKEEAMSNAKDAVIAYLQSLIEHGDPIPLGVITREKFVKRQFPFICPTSRDMTDLKVECTI